MIKIGTLLLFLFIYPSLHAQTDTIRIVKNVDGVYKCMNDDARMWYLYSHTNEEIILAFLKVPEKEVVAWFRRYKNSQNLFKGTISFQGNKKVLALSKHNQTDDWIRFEIMDWQNDRIVLKEMKENSEYIFEKISE